MQLKKQLMTAAAIMTLVAPLAAGAAELSSSQLGQVRDLLSSFGVGSSTISRVEGVLKRTTTATTTPALPKREGSKGQMLKAACIELSRNLSQGAQGDDVKKLQELLAEDSDSGFTLAPTGYFGPMTMRAMARYQEKHGIASTTTGHVGPLTRAFLMRACGKGLDGEQGERMRFDNSGKGSLNSGRGGWKNASSTDDDADDDSDDDSEDDSDDDADDA